MKRVWILALAVSVGLNAGLLYVTLSRGEGDLHGPRDGGPVPPEMHIQEVLENHLRRMTASLELDAEQRAMIQAVHEELLPQILEQHRTMSRLRRELAAHYAHATLEPAAFRALAGQLTKAQGELDTLVTEAMLAEAAAITPEQRKKYAGEMPWARRGLPTGGPPPDPAGPR